MNATPEDIMTGIILHRFIDYITPVVKTNDLFHRLTGIQTDIEHVMLGLIDGRININGAPDNIRGQVHKKQRKQRHGT